MIQLKNVFAGKMQVKVLQGHKNVGLMDQMAMMYLACSRSF